MTGNEEDGPREDEDGPRMDDHEDGPGWLAIRRTVQNNQQ